MTSEQHDPILALNLPDPLTPETEQTHGEWLEARAIQSVIDELEAQDEWRQVIAALRAKKVAFVPDEIQELWLDQYEYEASQELLNQL